MKSLAHPDYAPVLDAAGLSELERAVFVRWGQSPYIGFQAIGKLNGISDSEARAHFDRALDKLKPHWPKETTT